MAIQIYGLNCEWISSHGHSLVISKDSAWMESDLVPMEKKMLLNYPISRLLPLHLNEIDLQITLHYKLGSKKSLSSMLQQQDINETDCLRILYAIVSTILESASHLLNEERYLLHEQFIYIGADFMDIHLIYLPVLTLMDKPYLQQEIWKLAVILFEKQKSILSQNSKSLLLQLEASSFQLNSIKSMLFQYITETAFEPSGIINPNHKFPPDSIPQPIRLWPELEDPQAFEVWLPQTNKDRIQKWMQSYSHNPILVITCVVSVLIIWVLFMIYQSVGAFNLSLGLSLWIINLSFKLNRSIGKLETSELSGNNTFEKLTILQNPSIAAKEYYDHLAEQTTLLVSLNSSSDATVMLPRPKKAILELQHEEQLEIINITQNPFIIGRNTETSQYAVNWVGLSRKHVEITRNGTDYEVMDLGSKNGSFLNEEQMVPYKAYLLNDGDCIKIVEKQLIYKKI
jgi:hypothetical protein